MVSVKGKAWQRPCQVWIKEMSTSEPLLGVEVSEYGVKTVEYSEGCRISPEGVCLLSGVASGIAIRYATDQAFVVNVGTCRPDVAKGEIRSGGPTRMRRPGRGGTQGRNNS